MKFLFCLFCFLSTMTAVASGKFSWKAEEGRLPILLDGKPFGYLEWCPQVKTASMQRNEETLADGRRVFNLWSPARAFRYRMEAELAADASTLECSTITEWPAFSGNRTGTQISLLISWDTLGNATAYTGYRGAARTVNLQKGTIVCGQPFEASQWRFLSLRLRDGRSLSLDFNPIGPGECCSPYPSGIIRGMARCTMTAEGIRFSFLNSLDGFGGMTGAKLRLRLGGMENYDRDHCLRSFLYYLPLPASHLLSFGAGRHGKAYTSANDLVFSPRRGYGWLEKNGALRRIEWGSGAYYSHIQGKDATFRISSLKSALYLVTIGMGNQPGTPNDFSVSVNGQELLSRHTLPRGRFLTATLPIWIDKGIADIRFQGDFILSVIALQPLLAAGEDYQCRRGFWAVDGFEPSVLFRNAGYQPPATRFQPVLQESSLPTPGKEEAAPLKQLPAVIDKLDYTQPENHWLFHVRFEKAGINTACLNELAGPNALAKFLDGVRARGRNTVMLSGMHARHIYPQSEERVLEYIRRFCEAAHQRGLKVIDHHDLTLLYNTEAGFRTLAERLSEANRSVANQLPGPQLCIFNPVFQEKCLENLRKIVACGVDGLQLDECTVFGHAGACAHCREAFHAETGWELPMDETDEWYKDFQRPVTRVWYQWKVARTRNLKATLARELRKINPNIALTAYGTLHTFLPPYGLRNWNVDQLIIGRTADMYGHECLAENTIANARMFVPGQKLYDIFRYMDGTPIFTWLYTASWQTSYFGYAVCNMNAQSPVFYGKFSRSRAGQADFLSFDSSPDNMPRIGTASVSRLALLFSGQTRNWGEHEISTSSTFGCAQTLEEIHIPYQFIGEEALTAPLLAPFRAIYLGAASCLSDQQIEALRDFAQQGGTLIFEADAGTKDQFGLSRGDSPLLKLMGLEQPMASAGSLAMQASLNGKETVFAQGIPCMPIPVRSGSIGEVSLADGKKSPLAYRHSFGKGALVFLPVGLSSRMFARNIGLNEVNSFAPDPSATEIYRGVLRLILKEAQAIPFETDAPAKVYLTLQQNGDTRYIHLLNALGTGIPKGAKVSSTPPPSPFPPLKAPIRITLPCPKGATAFAVSPDYPGRRPLTLEHHDNGETTLILPPELLKVYTIIHLH